MCEVDTAQGKYGVHSVLGGILTFVGVCVCSAQMSKCAAWGDANMHELRKGEVLQLERKGYYIVDVPAAQDGQPAVLFSIPDGHQKKPAQQPPAAAAAVKPAKLGAKAVKKAASFK